MPGAVTADFVSADRAEHIVSTLPRASFSFAYGSAVIPQNNVAPSTRMVDIILAVKDPQSWHTENLHSNPAHYSFLSLLGTRAIAATQRSSFGARIYFNTIMGPAPFKYGVVAEDDLITDLTTWENLYVSGRMQKPIRLLSTPSRKLKDAMSANVNAAAAAALLTLPERFSEAELYEAVASLSYTHDVRMSLAVEVRSKVSDIVTGNIERFRAMYRKSRPLQDVIRGRDGVWRRAIGSASQEKLLSNLPRNVTGRIAGLLGYRERDVDRAASVDSRKLSGAVVAAIGSVVAKSSLRQTIKGLATAGVTTSARYVAAKLGRALRARTTCSVAHV